MFSNVIFKSLIGKWFIYHKGKELNDYGLKKGFLKSQKIKTFEKKNIFTGNCSCDLKISFFEIF